MTRETISMIEDGHHLTGTSWTLPSDYADDEIRRRELPSLKGASPTRLPGLGDQDDSEE